MNAGPVVSLQIQKSDKTELIVCAFPQGTSRGAEFLEMAKISLPLLDKRCRSIPMSVSGEEDLVKHACASMLVEAQDAAQRRDGG